MKAPTFHFSRRKAVRCPVCPERHDSFTDLALHFLAADKDLAQHVEYVQKISGKLFSDYVGSDGRELAKVLAINQPVSFSDFRS